MYQAEIKSITRRRHVASNSYFTEVIFDILNGESPIASKKLGMPDGMPVDDIKAEVQKFMAAYNKDAEHAKRQAELDKADDAVKSAHSELAGVRITN